MVKESFTAAFSQYLGGVLAKAVGLLIISRLILVSGNDFYIILK
jgi:hypothetical protein